MIRYLLGDLPEKEMVQLERLYFSNDELFDLLLALEDELFQRYTHNKLTVREKGLFEERCRTRPYAKESIAFAKTLARASTELAGQTQPAHAHPTPGWLRQLMEDFFMLRPVFKFAVAFSVVAIMVGSWLLFRTTIFRQESQTQQAQQIATQPKEEPKSITEQPPIGSEEKDARQKPKTAVITFVLSPGAMRDVGSMQRIVLSKTPAMVEMKLDLEGENEIENYDAVLYDERNKMVKRWKGLRSVRRANGLQVSLSLPSTVLEARRYRIELIGKRRFEYSFGVEGRRD